MPIIRAIFCLAALAGLCGKNLPDCYIYPRNVTLSVAGPLAVPERHSNQNATGRITPIGNFTGELPLTS